ncbi:MAG: hypothetical protein MZV63_17715 [Marinilabiliales bacterium]|nr:hypothetical protein [Marinilabiliales bacterium]
MKSIEDSVIYPITFSEFEIILNSENGARLAFYILYEITRKMTEYISSIKFQSAEDTIQGVDKGISCHIESNLTRPYRFLSGYHPGDTQQDKGHISNFSLKSFFDLDQKFPFTVAPTLHHKF